MSRFLSAGTVAFALLSAPVVVGAQDSEGFTWNTTTEVSYVSTSGNASSRTLGVKGSLEGEHAPHEVQFAVGGVRASSDVTSRRAVGTEDDFTVVETVRSETTAESYHARTRYDREFGRGFGFAGAGWERNTFAGVQNRFQIVGGLGRTFVRSETARFSLDAGLTYTIQKDVDPTPGSDDGFSGWRLSVDAMKSVSETSELSTELVVNNSFKDVEDVRADWLSSLSVSINSALALKSSLQLLWDNVPARVGVPLETPDGEPTGVEVLTPTAELDSVLTVTLVVRI
ncbi:MAG: DUF481 domain-containing protein [Gemmatimonadota bacterium]|nr:DUF481 domain-containing protein [Gemmatimonadota bacterium]